MATNPDAICLHCDAALTPRDLADGWCDSCGKRLPTKIRPKTSAAAVAPESPAGGGQRWVLALGMTAVALLGAAAAYAVAG